MKKQKKTLPENGMEELKEFHIRKKEEQAALKNLLKALDEKSKKNNGGQRSTE